VARAEFIARPADGMKQLNQRGWALDSVFLRSYSTAEQRFGLDVRAFTRRQMLPSTVAPLDSARSRRRNIKTTLQTQNQNNC